MLDKQAVIGSVDALIDSNAEQFLLSKQAQSGFFHQLVKSNLRELRFLVC